MFNVNVAGSPERHDPLPPVSQRGLSAARLQTLSLAAAATTLQVDVPHKIGYLKNNTDVYSTISGNLHTQIHKKYFCQVH